MNNNDNAGNESMLSEALLADDGVDCSDGPLTPNAESLSSDIRNNFLKMSTLFAINHGCTVSCLGLANARLGSIGIWQSVTVFTSYTVAALFGASYFVKQLGSRNGLVLGMSLCASYVGSFFLAAMDEDIAWLQGIVVITGALAGGVGSSILWVSQGTYFSSAAQLFASIEGEPVEDVTSRFGGNFAFLFLLFEVIMRLMSTFLIETVGLSWAIIFGIYSLLAILPVILMMGVMDLQTLLLQEDTRREEDSIAPSHKAAAALDLLKNDPKAKFLSPVNILFGLTTAFSASVISGEVMKKVLSDPNSTMVGLYNAITSMVAAVASLLFGVLEASHSRAHMGKGFVMTIGALSFMAVALVCIAYPNGDDWNYATLVTVYVMLGVGRATYEGTLRAIFADFFPNEKEGAFANIILFSGTASTIGYILSVTGALQCEETSRYCMEYSDGSIHNVFAMEIVIIVVAVIAIPAFWRALCMFRKEQNMHNNSIESQCEEEAL